MSHSEGDGPSYDPRTWTKPPTPNTGETAAAPDTSFDPTTWVAGAGPDRPAGARRSTDGIQARTRTAGVVAIALLLGGGGLFAFWSGHHHDRRRTWTITASDPPTPPAGQRRTLVVAGPADLIGALTSAGAQPSEAREAAGRVLAQLGPAGGELRLVLSLGPASEGARLLRLEARRDDGSGALVERAADGSLVAGAAASDLTTQIKDVRGEMGANDFYSSAVAAGLPDSLIDDFAQALTFDFDFQREVRQGDIFEAVFEQTVSGAGEPSGKPKLLFVLLNTEAKSAALYRFDTAGKQAGWFDGNGRSIVRAFMRTPVEGARISSTFGMREHPVLGFMKMHKGVDFAAPIGTPIYAAGDGVVTHAEPKALNGNYVAIQHDNGWQTLYLHMNAFAPGITPGARVRQGQQIGEVGITGRSTGPHLHYEMHINNEPVDPMAIPLQAGPVLDGGDRKTFFKARDRIDALRARQMG